MRFFFTLCLLVTTIIFNKPANSFPDTQAFKCSENGKVVYSQTPCKGSTANTVNLKTYSPTEAATQLATKDQVRRNTEIKKLEKIRHTAEAKEQAKNLALAKKASYEKKRCQALDLRVKWAKDDLANAKPKNEMRSRTRLKHAEEKTSLYCKKS